MTKHTYGEASIAALGGGRPFPARNRAANAKTAVVHLVVVLPRDHEEDTNRRSALCGAGGGRRFAGWVLNPSWPRNKPCATCYRREGL